MQFPHIDPVFLRLGPLEFRWYGLMYILGFLVSYFIILNGVKRREMPLSRDDVADFVFSLAVGVILGGRLGYVLFYNFSYYLANPLKVLAVWEGGMSFHGGLTGVILAGVLFARKKQINFMEMADICAFAGPVGLGLGRLGNFINSELYGRVTDMPWGIVFPGGGSMPRHPSQLYEAFLEGPTAFLLIWLLSRRRHGAGGIFWSFIGLYGLFRFVVEFFREPDAQIGYVAGVFTMGQLLSFPMLFLGAALAWRAFRRGGGGAGLSPSP